MHLRDLVRERVLAALIRAQSEQLLPSVPVPDDLVERPQNTARGDFASSAPLKLARTMHMAPMDIAQSIANFIDSEPIISNVEIYLVRLMLEKANQSKWNTLVSIQQGLSMSVTREEQFWAAFCRQFWMQQDIKYPANTT